MKLKCAFLAMTVAACSSQIALALSQSKHQANRAAVSPSLQLTTSLVKQELCDDGGVRVWVELHYKNMGPEPIILERFSASIYRYSISRNEQAAAKGNYEDNVLINRLVSTATNPAHGRTPPEDQFVILRSGESYDVDARLVGFLLILDSDVRRLSKGSHVLQVRVSTWDEPDVLAEELSVAWRKYGVLWWQDVTSLPMPFKIENRSATIKCS